MNPCSGPVRSGFMDINSGLLSGTVLQTSFGESGMNIKMLTGVILGCCIGGIGGTRVGHADNNVTRSPLRDT